MRSVQGRGRSRARSAFAFASGSPIHTHPSKTPPLQKPQGRGTLEIRTTCKGRATRLRELDDWSGKWKGLTSQYIAKLPLSKMGQVNSYGLGTLLHEVLHKKSVGGGFTHANMSQALGIGSCAAVGTQNGCSNAIAAACFPQ